MIKCECCDASFHTKARNSKFAEHEELDMTMNHEDYHLTSKGFLARLPRPVVIKSENGTPVFDLAAFNFIAENPASPPDTVNPSLWRQSFLHTKDGLFEGSKM